MDGRLRFYLLAEESGWNCTDQALNYGQKLRDSEEYRSLSKNVEEAKDHLSYKARGVVEAFDRLDFYTVTVKDCFILETSMDYLYLHSFAGYYLNPLAIDPNYRGEVSSLGDLIFDYDGDDVTLNEIILDEDKSLEHKMEQIEPRLDYYASDMRRITKESIDSLRSHDDGRSRFKDGARHLLEYIFFIIVNLFLVVTWVNPFELFFDHFYDPVYYHVMTYLAYLYPLLVLIYDVIFIIYHTYKANITEPYNYARRFLKKNTDDVYDVIDKTKERLTNYIRGAIYAKIKLNNDITEFSCLSQSYVDLQAIQNVEKKRAKRSYRILHGLLSSMTTIMMIAFIFFFIVYVVAYIFQVNI